jgi:xanthine dehydrogenase accessory factor
MFVDAEGARHGTPAMGRSTSARRRSVKQRWHRAPAPPRTTSTIRWWSRYRTAEAVIAGGGHVALAIARQARLLDFDVTILEDRPEFAQPQRFEGASVIQGDVPEAIASLHYRWSSSIIIATRGHKLDADCVLAAVRTKARYIGLLGSRRKTILIEEMLAEHGVAPDRVRAIHAPVGLDLGGRTPAEIALSVMAEIVQELPGQRDPPNGADPSREP